MAPSGPFFNRELSRLDYIRRILSRAEDEAVPLLERLRFVTYCARNLDEFFMIRVGSTRDLMDAGVIEASPDGLAPGQQLIAIRKRAREILADMYRLLAEGLVPALDDRNVAITPLADVSDEERAELRQYFTSHLAPLLTPLAIDPGHPFPFVTNLAMNLAVVVESKRAGRQVVLLKLPQLLPRFIALPDNRRFVPVESLVVENLDVFFPRLAVREVVHFRVIRNSELTLEDDEIEDIRATVEAELRRRERRQVVYLEVDAGADDAILEVLISGTRVRRDDIYPVTGILKLSDLAEICNRVPDPALRYPEFNPRLPQRVAASADIFSVIRAGDVLLHRPYDSFTAIVELLHAAATDPDVVAIKQTLYQTDDDSPVVDKLALAALNGKQVTVVIELQARFEEKKNIALAGRLQDAGVQVVYGLVGLQAHAKVAVVVRSEEGEMRRYVHLSTGNYNAGAARSYTDCDLLTADEEFGREASLLMNVLTGYSAASLADVLGRGGDRPRWSQLVLAPFDYHRWLLGKIEREAEHAAAKKPARITAQLNSLVDPQVIQALYAASSAGVEINLVIRAMCCLVPGLPGVSERIRVTSVVDRFLEHTRIIRFENGGAPEVFLSSGDWMPRNFQRRVEVTFPLRDPANAAAAESMLAVTLADGAAAWELRSDGSWQRRSGGVASQEQFIERSRAESVRQAPYEEMLRQPAKMRKKGKKRLRAKS